MLLGIDEVGRGAWAGPLVVGAVVLGGAQIDGLTDSKKLTKSKRVCLDIEIRQKAAAIGLGWVDANELDKIGLSRALVEATKRAVEQINASYHEIIIDGTVNFLSETNKGKYVKTLKKADLLIPSVSAASIVAKVARDNYMYQQDEMFPEYGFKKHVGYGTAFHNDAIQKNGITPLHRLSFAPLAKYRRVLNSDNDPEQNGFAQRPTRAPAPCQALAVDVLLQNHCQIPKLTSRQIGDFGEDIATNYLVRLGHNILDRNWKTKYCEIDIVSKYNGTIYFTEVKYRHKDDHGDGLSAITKKKLNQMKFAANSYVQSNNLDNTNILLAVLSLSGEKAEVIDYIEI